MSALHFIVKEHVLPCQYVREYPGATLDDQEDTLHLHIKQYKPKDPSHSQPGAATIIGAHANGFPKELYEPFWDELYQALKAHGQAIRSIWIADIATQGTSGILNENKLGNDPSWNDHPRDLLHMINHFRKEMPRPLVGIGHSLGGCNLCQLSYIHPRLLTSLVLIDPVIELASAAPKVFKAGTIYARSSTYRRDRWPSRAEAVESFKKSVFYQSWDPRVLDLWLKHGLRKLPTAIYPTEPQGSAHAADTDAEDGPVTLATSKHQEVFMFLRPNFKGKDENGNTIVNRKTHPDIATNIMGTYPFYAPTPPAVFQNLPHLRPNALYVFGGKSDVSTPDSRKQKVARTGTGVGGSGGFKEGRVAEAVVEEAGHLVPMIAPQKCADAAAGFLAADLKRWREGEEEWRRRWEGKDRLEKMTVDEEWIKHVGADPRVRSTQKL